MATESSPAPIAEPEPRSSRCIGGRFELLHPIGEGACASVWLARHQDTGAFCAAKLIEASSTQEALRFEREAELSARLTHRNLVRVFDYVREDAGHAALIMEHLRGETVEDALRRHGTLPPAAAVALLIAVLRGVEHAHSQQIVHRDLKATNIFLSVEPDGLVIPKILDFGIAKSTEDESSILLTQQGLVLGTPAYMSPEQVRGEKVGPASDLFSLGAVLYELLTGALLFRAPSAHAAMLAILHRDAEPHEAIPADVWAVLERALAKPVEERWASAADMRIALEHCACYAECDPDEALRALDLRVPELPAHTPRSSAPSIPAVELTPAPNTANTPTNTMPAEALPAAREPQDTMAPVVPLEIPGLSRTPRGAIWAVAAAAVLVLSGTSLLGRTATAAATQPDARARIVRRAPAPAPVAAPLPRPVSAATSSSTPKSPPRQTAAQKALAAKLGPPPPTDARPAGSPATKTKRR